MCGYCYEDIMLHIVETGERYDRHQFCYLEETDDLKTEINQLQNPNEPEHLIDLPFCRLYDHYLTQRFDAELFDSLRNKFGENAVAAYLARRQACTSQIFRDELSQIRFELIYYILLKVDTKPAEVNKLKEAILSENEHPMLGMMESEHIIELVEKLVA